VLLWAALVCFGLALEMLWSCPGLLWAALEFLWRCSGAAVGCSGAQPELQMNTFPN